MINQKKHLLKGLSRGRGREMRAAALLITVLISVIAASIAMSLVKVVLENGSSNGEAVNFVKNKNMAYDNLNYTVSELNSDPLSLYQRVLSKEAPRRCEYNGLDYQPGSTWPQICGTSWSYAGLNTLSEYVMFSNFSTNSRSLTLTSVSRSGSLKVGYSAVIKIAGNTNISLYSASDLDLSKLVNNASFTGLKGNFYSASSIKNWDDISTSESYFFSEEDFSPLPEISDEGSGFLGSKFASSKIYKNRHIYPLRNIMPTVLDNTGFRSNLSKLINFNCQSGDSTNLTLNSKNYNSKLCLRAGDSISDSSGNSIVIPSASSFVIIPESSTLAIYYPTGALYDPVANCSTCSIPELIADQYDTEREGGPLPPNPGFLSSYTKLGNFNYPLNNTISVDSDVIVGFCGAGFLDQGCASNGAANKSRFTSPITIIAGTLNSPKKIYIGQGVESQSGKISLIATDYIVVPYWASSPGGSLAASANLATFSSSKGIATSPIGTSSIGQNPSQILYIDGAIYSTSFTVEIDSNLYSSYKLDPSASFLPPLFTYPVSRWEINNIVRVAPSEIA